MPPEPLRRSVLRSGAFRFALLFAAIFAVGSALVLLTVQQQIDRYADAATEGSLHNETKILASEYGALGRGGLTDAIQRHSSGRDPQFRFRLVDGDGRVLAGDLPANVRLDGRGTLELREVDLAVHGERIETFKTLGTPLADGLRLVVATDTFDVRALMERLGWFTLASGIGITLFALVGGYFVGSLFVRRLHGVNTAVNRIMTGALHERLPAIGMGPEFDELSQNLNRMLDRIQSLMDGLRQVSTDIAHDLRTPLTRLHQQLEALRRLDTVEALDAGIEGALVQTDEILAIFRALLRIGALEGGVGRGRLAQIDLSEVMERVAAAYGPVAEDAGKTLDTQIEPDRFVLGDRELVAQAATNLIENALLHTPPGTRIQLRLSGNMEGTTLAVADNGPGIPKGERSKVLERFYRLDASRSTPGSGLGLAMVQAIAALHEAILRLDDNRPGLAISLAFPSTTPEA
ncbi:ATP-binding protein [Novosphingobium clariflavum]|uniref:histidine kinase n=1 Tax=Novosphingobium clariflavum TaxID=2029884 RepID=A0ABV6SCH8_9SPHN|nr:ATP-binding protein [Novosphingobium clariflavum]